MTEDILRMENITKIYSNGFIANKNVNLVIRKGEIHALVGENGAGKTTLMKVLFGMEDFQEGRILIRGKSENIKDPLDAIAKGVGMVHQHFMQVPSLTVAENVTLGIEPGKGIVFDKLKAKEITQEISEKYNLRVNSDEIISNLSVSLRQKVEILKALVRDCELLILDEPTAVLTPQETEQLFVELKFLKEKGISIIFISHKLAEVMQLCDRVTVLRKGRVVGTDDVKNLDSTKISRMMVGRDVILTIDKEPPSVKETVLSIKDLHYKNNDNVEIINGVSFGIRGGEIVGIAGVEGNGQNEIAEIIAGMRLNYLGEIQINGTNIKNKSIRQIRDLGLSYISEDRMRYGCAPEMSVSENILADRIQQKEFRKWGFLLNDKKLKKTVDQLIEEFEIACDGRSELVRLLSGGNIQKVIVAREFSNQANLIIANQPTRGIDVGTTEMIRKTLVRKARDNDVATLLISSDLNEVLEVSDRLLVMKDGQIVAHFKDVKNVSEIQLGEYMLGVKKMSLAEMGEMI